MSIEINFVAATPLNSNFSSGGFLATLTVKSADLTNSTLTFKSNLSLNGISVECQDAGVFPIYSKNTTLALIGICINLLHTVCYINAVLIVLPSSPAPLNSSVLNCSSMNITWTTPTNTGGEGISITSYMIIVYPPPSLSYSSCIGGVCNTTEEFFILSGLSYSTNYIINVSASNCAGTGSIASTSMQLITGDFNFVN